MAKPYEGLPPDLGLQHAFPPVLDKNGNNVFDDGGPQGTAIHAPTPGLRAL